MPYGADRHDGWADGPGEVVAVTTIDNLGLDACHLIKIDVQGMEREVLLGAAETIRSHRPLLYVENDLRKKSEALIGQILEMDYRPYWHVPRLYNPDNYRSERRNVFGDTVNENMLCRPSSRGRQIERLRAVASVHDWWQEA
ncbi:MAG: FkbM family methyltransferase [Alphaproteobacteria bacterium]|nr:FkbM family methyltransferase [Alphaproteobacteria bacterium]